MVMVIPHCDMVLALGREISSKNVLHGILYHYVILDVLCWGCEQNYFSILGMEVEIKAPAELSNCAQVRKDSEEKMSELVAACEGRGLRVPELRKFFFQVRDTPLILRGDSKVGRHGDAPLGRAQEEEEEEEEEGAGGAGPGAEYEE